MQNWSKFTISRFFPLGPPSGLSETFEVAGELKFLGWIFDVGLRKILGGVVGQRNFFILEKTMVLFEQIFLLNYVLSNFGIE